MCAIFPKWGNVVFNKGILDIERSGNDRPPDGVKVTAISQEPQSKTPDPRR